MRIADCGLPSLALQAGKGWVMDLLFPFVFSEDETMRLSLALQAGKGWAMDLRFPFLFNEDETM